MSVDTQGDASDNLGVGRMAVLKGINDVLDRETSDVYPINVRVRLAECALRRASTVEGAIRWLREAGHLE